MWARLSIVAGLLVGVVAAGLLLGGLLALAPETPLPSVALPSFAVASVAPSPVASQSPVAPSPSDSPSPIDSPSASGSGDLESVEPDAPFHVGQPAPALVVPQVGGGTIDLASLKGHPVWINFMSTVSPATQDEFPLMNGFAARHADDGLVVIAVDVQEEEDAVKAFASGLGATFPVGLDADRKAAIEWDALALPVHFWIDKDGIVRDGAFGGIGADVMAEGLKTIMPGVVVTP